MKSEFSFAGILSFAILGTVFLFGFLILAVRLKDEQVDFASLHRSDMQAQSFRRIQTVGMRGRILDRNGIALAENVPVHTIPSESLVYNEKQEILYLPGLFEVLKNCYNDMKLPSEENLSFARPAVTFDVRPGYTFKGLLGD